jgi:hypothetical protein
MALVTNGRLIYKSIPTGMSPLLCCKSSLFLNFTPLVFSGYPEPGKTTLYDTTETIDLQTVALNGGFLIKTLELSIDPYFRGRMREATVNLSYSVSF